VASTFDPKPVIAPTLSADVGKPDRPPSTPELDAIEGVDVQFWERALSDAERAEKDWRSRGREIIRIYRNDGSYSAQNRKTVSSKDVVFNILFSNTEVMLPNIYSTPPKPVVRSRFVKRSEPAEPPAPPPSLGGAAMGVPPPPMGPAGPTLPPGGGAAPPPPLPGAGMLPPAPAGPPVGNGAQPLNPSPPMGGPPMPPPAGPIAGDNTGGMAEAVPPDLNIRVTTEDTTPPPPPEAPPPPKEPGPPTPQPIAMTGLQPAPPAPGMPAQKDIETAAAVMEKALEIVLNDNASHEAVKASVKDLLLPGRGTVRVRWHPEMQPSTPAAQDDPTAPPEMVKVWETVNDEYVYWEDVLFDPVRQFSDTQWVAFRHLFTEKQLLREFDDSEQLQKLKAKGRMDDLLKWTEEAAAKNTVGGGGAMKTSDKLGDVIRKAMVWEIWNRDTREIIWFIREVSGIVLRVDPDSLGLTDFFPIPKPLLAVTTTDSLLPRPYYDLYRHLASDLDNTSRRISDLTDKIKVRGGYNAANRDIANMLLADDGKMIPVDGVDLINGGLQNHIWLVPILEWVNALKELYIAREQIKGAIYEVMGISDIMRGNTNPYETATAQRIKGTMGTNRLDGQKMVCANFALDLLRMKAEIVAKNFDAFTLTRMTGEEVTPPVEAILRDDFQRTCSIDIETDSTVSIDETQEQESNAKILMAMQGILQGAQGLLMTGVLPPPMVIQFTLELIKMMIQPLRNSRGVVELLDDFQEQLAAAAMTVPPMPPPGMATPGGGPPGASPPPLGPPGGPPPGPTQMNGGGAPMPMGPMS
jgi:hypothetical protein